MNETQGSVAEWIDATFPGTDPDSSRKSIRALEEMVELCLASGATPDEIEEAAAKAVRSSVKEGRGRDSREFDPIKIPTEAADVMIVLYGIASMRRFDLLRAVDFKMAVNRDRRWKTRGDGTGYHIPTGRPPVEEIAK